MNSLWIEQVFKACQYDPSKYALVNLQGSLVTYGQLLEKVSAAIALLRAYNVHPSEPVLLSASKHWGFIYAYLALHAMGAIAVPLDPSVSDERINFIKNATGARTGFWLGGAHELHDINELDQLTGTTDTPRMQAVPHNIADIMFTSGTTGEPKGVCLTHANIASSVRNINLFVGNSRDDIEINPMPLSHSFGMARMRCTLAQGATLVAVDGVSKPKALFNAIEEFGVTGLGMVGPAWGIIKRLSGSRISRYKDQLRYIEFGSAIMPTAEKKELCDLLPGTRICMHYGLTEASRATFIEFHSEEAHLDTLGKASPLVEIAIFDPQGQILDANAVGEICVKGPMVTSGYWGKNEPPFFKDYFRTGDVGYKRSDGYIVLVGRIKEMINVAGEKVSPADVEKIITSLPHITGAACIAMKDPVANERVALFAISDGKYEYALDEIRALTSGKLTEHQMPCYIQYISELPKTDTGKIQRLRLQNMLPEHLRMI